jgi:phosphate transport system substrate-binding protein
MRRILPALFFLLALGPALGAAAEASDPVRLRGAGEEFLGQLVAEWIYRTHPNVDVRYGYLGSQEGFRDFSEGAEYFAGAQVPMDDVQLRKSRIQPVLEVPLSVGGVTPIYNLPIPGLRFSGKTLSRIFLGEITSWKDPAIAADNPGKELPDQRLIVVRRSDESESTYYFSAFLAGVSPEFNQRAGIGGSVTWPVRMPELQIMPTSAITVDVEGDDEVACANPRRTRALPSRSPAQTAVSGCGAPGTSRAR